MVYLDAQADSATMMRGTYIVPHKRLWRLTAADGAELACELEALTSHRVLLVVKRNGDPIVTETFADKRDALARSVGVYKEMKEAGSRDEGTSPPDESGADF